MAIITTISGSELLTLPTSVSSGGGSATIPGTPLLYYKNEDLPASLGVWPNSGSAGSAYNLYNYSSCSITTTSGYRSLYMQSSSRAAFSNNSRITFIPSSQSVNFAIFVVAYVPGGDYLGFLSDYSMPYGSSPASIGPNSHPTGYTWYANDGGPFSWTWTSSSNGVTTQYAMVYTNDGYLRVYEAATPSATYTTSSNTYGADFYAGGIGSARSNYPTNSRILEMAVYTSSISPATTQLIRNYFAAKFPVGRVNV